MNRIRKFENLKLFWNLLLKFIVPIAEKLKTCLLNVEGLKI